MDDDARIEHLENILQQIKTWCNAYPLAVFTEPDWAKAHKVLTENGMTLDGISAAAMRHVLSGIVAIIEAADG
jgi:hypothetical protein